MVDYGHDDDAVEAQLSLNFRLTSHWKAPVLLDKADIFVQKRSLSHYMNEKVSVLLRKLEYHQGVMFLTTNRVKDFDDAIQSQSHLAFKYGELSMTTKRIIWERFLSKAMTGYGPVAFKPKELDNLAKGSLNGRQVTLLSQSA